MINIDLYNLPEAVQEELAHIALSPQQEDNFHTLLLEGEFTRAYAIFWNEAAEDLLVLQTKKHRRPTKCNGRGSTPTFKTQPLAARGTFRVEAGAATEWKLILSKLIRSCLGLEAMINRAFQLALAPGYASFARAESFMSNELEPAQT